MEHRLDDVESRLAFQEHTLQELNEVIIQQQDQIDRLQNQIRLLKQAISEVSQPGMLLPGEEPPPPHY